MKGEKLYELLDLLDDNLVMESAEVKRGVWRRRLAIVAAIVAAAVLVWFVTTEPVRHPRQDVGGEAGVLQDGAYYVFAGSGFPGPDEARVPQGIFRYVPGEGKEQLVSYQAHRMDVLFSCWGVNTHSLYYVDIDTNALWRQDLTTGEETLLYTAPGPEEPEAELGVGDLWNYFAHGEELELTYDVALFLNQVGEDTVTLTYRYPDGKTTDTVVLDSRTGALLSQTAQRENGYPLWLGERCIEVVYVDHPEGFTYPGWEEDVELNQYHWTDLQEDGRSLLPPGTMGAGEQAAIEIPGGPGLYSAGARGPGGFNKGLPGRGGRVAVLYQQNMGCAGQWGAQAGVEPLGQAAGDWGRGAGAKRVRPPSPDHRWHLVLPERREHHRLLPPGARRPGPPLRPDPGGGDHLSTETKPPLKADAFGGGLCLVRERGFRVLGEGAGLQAGLALLLLGGHENAQIMLGQKDLGEHGNAGIQAEAIPQNPQGGAVAQVEGVQGQDILPVLPDQVEIGPLVLGCLIRQLVIDRVKQVCGLLAGPGVAGAVDGLIQHLLGDQAGQGGGEGLVGEILLEPGAQPLLDGEGEEPAEDVPVFFLQGGQDLFLLGGQQVLQGGAGCLGLLRGDGAALGIQCFLGTGEELC